jgi:hypothetical protein
MAHYYWWAKAAAQGNKFAQSNLANLDAMMKGN